MSSDVHELMTLVESLLQYEPGPEHPPEPMPIPAGDTPLDTAFAGLFLAINAVTEADYAVRVRELEERRNRLLDWRKHLQDNPIPDSRGAADAIHRGELTVEQAVMGNGQWAQMLDDLNHMLSWGAEQHTESLRKSTTIGNALIRTLEIGRRTDEQIRQIREGRDTDEARRQLQAISDVAVAQTHQLTRQILDLNENTAAISTAEWLDRHGL